MFCILQLVHQTMSSHPGDNNSLPRESRPRARPTRMTPQELAGEARQVVKTVKSIVEVERKYN
jgi:hypothetical protein